MLGSSSVATQLAASQEGLSSMSDDDATMLISEELDIDSRKLLIDEESVVLRMQCTKGSDTWGLIRSRSGRELQQIGGRRPELAVKSPEVCCYGDVL
jgi:hypothetical protein